MARIHQWLTGKDHDPESTENLERDENRTMVAWLRKSRMESERERDMIEIYRKMKSSGNFIEQSMYPVIFREERE